MKPTTTTSLLAALLLAVATPALAACSSSSQASVPAAEAPPIPIRIAAVERARRARPIRATGSVSSSTEVRASFKIGGIVAALAVDEGDPVTRGQVIGRLVLAEIDASVEQARQGVTKSTRDLARAQTLLEGKAATREQVDDATTGLAVARAQLRAAQFNAQHAVIRAPADGRVLRRMAEVGELVGAGQPVLLLAGESGANGGWKVRVNLSDRDVVRLAKGDRATLRLDAFPGQAFTAVVDELASGPTPPTGTFAVELALDAAPPVPLTGLVAHVEIAPTPTLAHDVALIPAAALRDGDGLRAAVWVRDGADRVVRRAVEIAFFDGERVAVARGLDGVTEVITDGAAYLRTDSRIEVAPPAGPKEARR